VAEGAERTVQGFAEFRPTGGDSAHLSYICVHPEARGQGLAEKIIRHFVEMHRSPKIDLQVFTSNEAALALYRRLGFDSGDQTVWYTRELPAPVAGAPIVAHNLPFALAAFRRFGFCEYNTSVDGEPIRVGRIGPGVLRLFDAGRFDDVSLLARLAHAFPDAREALIIAPDGLTLGDVASRSIHMTGTIEISKK
jgi:GNAT superfamily N-acetyltransferase